MVRTSAPIFFAVKGREPNSIPGKSHSSWRPSASLFVEEANEPSCRLFPGNKEGNKGGLDEQNNQKESKGYSLKHCMYWHRQGGAEMNDTIGILGLLIICDINR